MLWAKRSKISPLFSRQITWVWAMVLIAMVIYAFTWFMNLWWLWTFIEAIEASFTFDPPADATVVIIKNVIAWHPIIALFGWLLWGFRNSLRRDVRTYEQY